MRKNLNPDLSLARSLINNEEGLLKSIYVENYPKVLSFIVKNNGNEEFAKDIFQEAFICLWKTVKAGKFIPSSRSAINAYLYRIARNMWIDQLKSHAFKNIKSVPDDLEMRSSVDSDMSADERYNDTEKAALRNCLNYLDGSCKKILIAFYYNRASMKEIAESFEIETASARNKKYRCMEKLRAAFLEEMKNVKKV